MLQGIYLFFKKMIVHVQIIKSQKIFRVRVMPIYYSPYWPIQISQKQIFANIHNTLQEKHANTYFPCSLSRVMYILSSWLCFYCTVITILFLRNVYRCLSTLYDYQIWNLYTPFKKQFFTNVHNFTKKCKNIFRVVLVSVCTFYLWLSSFPFWFLKGASSMSTLYQYVKTSCVVYIFQFVLFGLYACSMSYVIIFIYKFVYYQYAWARIIFLNMNLYRYVCIIITLFRYCTYIIRRLIFTYWEFYFFTYWGIPCALRKYNKLY